MDDELEDLAESIGYLGDDVFQKRSDEDNANLIYIAEILAVLSDAIKDDQLESKWGEALEQMPDTMLHEWWEVASGKALLSMPDGTRWWVPVGGSIMQPRIADEVHSVLLDYLIDHKCYVGHMGPNLPIILFEARTLKPWPTFCMDCCRWIDLSKEAEVFDEQGNRVPED